MPRSQIWLVLLLLFGLTSQCGSADPFWQPRHRPAPVPYRYSPPDSSALFLQLYAAPRDKDAAPLIAILDGDRWQAGGVDQFSDWARYFAARGAAVALIDYQAEQQTSPFSALRNVKSAVRFIRANAQNWKIDPNQLAIIGADAGGQLSMGAATVQYYNNGYDDLNIPARPQLQVLLAPLLDLSPNQPAHKEIGEAWPTFSPLHTVTAAVPPSLLLVSSQDSLLPLLTVRHFRDSIRAVGQEVQISRYEGGHRFYELPSNRKNCLEQIDQWLIEQKFLGGKPHVKQFRGW